MRKDPESPVSPVPASVLSALSAIVEGNEVKRSVHDLRHDGTAYTAEFLSVLALHGYRPATVAAVRVEPGRRAPAFFLEGPTAWFGWVFWEKFSGTKQRKLFGSVVRNAKGDWAIQIPPSRTVTIHVNEDLATEVDADRPSSL
jgi:hypothetical protein